MNILDNCRHLFRPKVLTPERKLEIIRSYYLEVFITPDAVGFYTMIVRTGNPRRSHVMRAVGVSHEEVINDIYDRLNFRMSMQSSLLSSR